MVFVKEMAFLQSKMKGWLDYFGQTGLYTDILKEYDVFPGYLYKDATSFGNAGTFLLYNCLTSEARTTTMGL